MTNITTLPKLRILNGKNSLPDKLDKKSQKYVIDVKFKQAYQQRTASQELFLALKTLISKEYMQVRLKENTYLSDYFKKDELLTMMLCKELKSLPTYKKNSNNIVSVENDIEELLLPQPIKRYEYKQYEYCVSKNKISNGVDQITILTGQISLSQKIPALEENFLEEKLNSYQIWRHHIIGYKPYLKSIISTVKAVIDAEENSNSNQTAQPDLKTVKKTEGSIKKNSTEDTNIPDSIQDAKLRKLYKQVLTYCHQYNKKAIGNSAFSTKIIWNPRNLFCGPSSYFNKLEIEAAYLGMLPEERQTLIKQIYDNLKSDFPKDEVSTINQDKLDALIDFFENWEKLLPDEGQEYIFNHIAVFYPAMQKNQIKFHLSGVAI